MNIHFWAKSDQSRFGRYGSCPIVLLYKYYLISIWWLKMIFYIPVLTPSQDKKEPPLFGELTKNHHQHEVEHDTFTEHPAERSQKKVMQQACHKCTTNLHSGSWIDMYEIDEDIWNCDVITYPGQRCYNRYYTTVDVHFQHLQCC